MSSMEASVLVNGEIWSDIPLSEYTAEERARGQLTQRFARSYLLETQDTQVSDRSNLGLQIVPGFLAHCRLIFILYLTTCRDTVWAYLAWYRVIVAMHVDVMNVQGRSALEGKAQGLASRLSDVLDSLQVLSGFQPSDPAAATQLRDWISRITLDLHECEEKLVAFQRLHPAARAARQREWKRVFKELDERIHRSDHLTEALFAMSLHGPGPTHERSSNDPDHPLPARIRRMTDLFRTRFPEEMSSVFSRLSLTNETAIRRYFHINEELIATTVIRRILNSAESLRVVGTLRSAEAECFLDALYLVKANPQLRSEHRLSVSDASDLRRRLHRLALSVCRTGRALPSRLFLHDVVLRQNAPIAFGGFSNIYLAAYRGADVAMKLLRVFERETVEADPHHRLYKESLIWQDLDHPYILPLLGIDRDTFSPYLCMVSPWMTHGNLMQYLRKEPDADINLLLARIAEGLAYLHARHVVHGDLRGANILVDDALHPRLADLGLSSFADTTDATHTTRGAGATRWMAPELLSAGDVFRRTPESDVYAFGCVVLELYTQAAPFLDVQVDALIVVKVNAGERPARPSRVRCHGREMPDALWEVVQECWAPFPSDRPTAMELAGWLKEFAGSP